MELQASNRQSKSNTSQKDSSKNNLSVEGDGDFWSSFLGTSSPSASSSASSSADKKRKTSSSSKQNDSKTQNRKTDDQGVILEKQRQKRKEKRTNDSSLVTENMNASQKKISNKEDNETICEKETSIDEKDGNGKIDIGNEMRMSDSSRQKPQDKGLNTTSDGEKNKGVTPVNEEQKLSLVTETNSGDKWEISEVDDINKGDFGTNSSCTSQNRETGMKDNDREDIDELRYDEGKESSNLSPETSDSLSTTEDSENVDIVSKNIESLLHAAPRATSTPYAGKVKVSTGDDGLGRKSKSLLMELGGESRTPEQEKSTRKEPVEDDCSGEDIITGSVYEVEENMPDDEDNLEKQSTDAVMDSEGTEGTTIKPSKEGESTETYPAMEDRDSQEDNLEVTGELTIDTQNFVKEEEKESVIPEQSLEVETLAAQEDRTEEPNSIQVQTLLKVGTLRASQSQLTYLLRPSMVSLQRT